MPLEPGATRMDVLDAQIHLGTGMIQATLEEMDSLGISAVLLDEFWGTWTSDDRTHIAPGYRLPNGSWRAAYPTAEQASILYPDRFSYLVRIDRRDPDLGCLMRILASSPHARAVRVQPVWTAEEASHFANGGYEPVFELAGEYGLPVFLFIPGQVELLRRYLSKFPKVVFIIDHCGMGFAGIPPDRPAEQARGASDPSYFGRVLELAEFPNVALKWSHAQDLFGVHDFPFPALRPILRQAIDAFGADRLLWASDKTVIRGHSWADLLYCLLDDADLSQKEKEMLLGGSARRILAWPPDQPKA